MAADLHIHVVEGITEQDIASFFSNTLGSKHFKPRVGYDEKLFSRISESPNIHVGEVSWLKAGLMGNEEDAAQFIPSAVQKIYAIIGEELPVIDDALIGAVSDALHGPNDTGYTVDAPAPIIAFLADHKGKRCFTVSW